MIVTVKHEEERGKMADRIVHLRDGKVEEGYLLNILPSGRGIYLKVKDWQREYIREREMWFCCSGKECFWVSLLYKVIAYFTK